MHPTETDKAQHAAGPLYLGYGRNPDDGAFYLRAGRREVAILDTNNSLIDEANAERIASCWNACQGIPDPASAVPALVAALEKLWGFVEDLRTSNPGYLGKLVLQDYAQLNEALIETPRALALAQGGKR